MKNKFLFPLILLASLFVPLNLFSQHEYYGMSHYGGNNNSGGGTIFKTDSTGANFVVLHSFNGTTEGGGPEASLTLAPNGKFYGFTGGGVTGDGVLFQYDPVIDSVTVLLNLVENVTGSGPISSPLLGSDGSFYGVTSDIAAKFFKFNPTTGLDTNYNIFWWTEYPKGDVIEINGNIYGVTEYGGGNGVGGYAGRLYRFNIATQTFTYIHDFLAAQGYSPVAPPTLWTNGLLYGTTGAGGTYSKGVIYSYNLQTNVYTELLSLSDSFQSVDGRLLLATDNKMYGITYTGGPNDQGHYFGTLFCYDPATNNLQRRSNFYYYPQATNGTNGVGELMEASNGKIYGTTTSGIFQFNFATDDSVSMRSYQPIDLSAQAIAHLTELCTKPRYRYYADSIYSFCTGTTFKFPIHCPNATGIQWLHNGVVDATRTTDSLNFASITLADSGTWQCVLTNQCGTTRPGVITIHVGAAGNGTVTSIVTPGDTSNICPGSSITLHGNNGGMWNTGAASSTLQVSVPGTYWVANTNSCGLTLSNIVTVDTIPAPQAPWPLYWFDTTTLCAPGDSIYIWGNTGGVWSTGDTSYGLWVKQPGTYYITLNNGCSADTSPYYTNPTIGWQPAIQIAASTPTLVCGTDSVLLSCSTNTCYWSNGGFGGAHWVTTTGDYYAYAYTYSCGNIYSNVIHVQIDTVPIDSVNIIPQSPTTFCFGDSVILQSSYTGGYNLWTTGDTGTSIVVKNPDQYQVTAQNGCNTVSSAIVNVNVDMLGTTTPYISATAVSNYLCSGDIDTLTVTPAQYYTWSNTSNQQFIFVSQSGSYSVTVSDSVGCSATSQPVSITVSSVIPATPVIHVVGSDSACNGGTVELRVQGLGYYMWPDGSTGGIYYAANSGQYTVTAYGVPYGGCSATSAPVSVSILPPPAPPVIFALNPADSCRGSVILTFDTTGWQYYGWIGNDTTPFFIPVASGTVRVLATNQLGCSAVSGPFSFTVKPASFDTLAHTMCTGDYYMFNGRTLTAAGLYNDTLTNAGGCDSIVTLVLNLTNNTLQHDTLYANYCQGDTTTFNGHVITQNTSYNDTVMGTGGCDSILSTSIFSFRPKTYGAVSHTICQGDTFFVGATAFTQTGTFNPVITNAGGCDSVVTLTLTVKPAPVVTLSFDSLSETRPLFNGNTYCPGWGPDSFALNEGYPTGGIYTGDYIHNNIFYGDSAAYGHDTISYTYTSINGCSASAWNVIYVDICSGINTVPGTNLFNLYPNPANDYTMIDFDADYTGATIFVKDITGRQLYQTQLSTSPQQIPTGNLPPGVYLVTMYSNGGVGARLLVKE